MVNKHGLSRERLYNIHYHMLRRTSNPEDPAYADYGGRGISVCKEWSDSELGVVNFYNWAMNSGYSKELTLDRKDNCADYSPDNCRWVSYKEQNNNKRSNKLITFNGQTKTLTEWSESLGGYRGLVRDRLRKGWNEEDAVSVPIDTSKQRWKKATL